MQSSALLVHSHITGKRRVSWVLSPVFSPWSRPAATSGDEDGVSLTGKPNFSGICAGKGEFDFLSSFSPTLPLLLPMMDSITGRLMDEHCPSHCGFDKDLP